MISTRKIYFIFSCFIIFLISFSSALANSKANNKKIERNIKVLEKKISDYEKKKIIEQNKKQGLKLKGSSVKTKNSAKNKKQKKIDSLEEAESSYNIDDVGYDSKTKEIVSKDSNNTVEIDADILGSIYTDKIYLNEKNDGGINTKIVGTENLTVDQHGNLIVINKQDKIVVQDSIATTAAVNQKNVASKKKNSARSKIEVAAHNLSTLSINGKDEKEDTQKIPLEVSNDQKASSGKQKSIEVQISTIDVINEKEENI